MKIMKNDYEFFYLEVKLLIINYIIIIYYIIILTYSFI